MEGRKEGRVGSCVCLVWGEPCKRKEGTVCMEDEMLQVTHERAAEV